MIRSAEFGRIAMASYIFRQKAIGGGGVLDIGIYGLQFVTMVLGNKEPKKIQVVGALNKNGVDEYANINLEFDDSQVATICYSISNNFENTALIFGSKGNIKVGYRRLGDAVVLAAFATNS